MASAPAKKILIIEDEKDILQLVKLYLEKEGYRAVTAATGTEGLDSAKQHKPDLIVLDLMLPWISGVEVLATIREMPALRTVPVLVVTGTNTRAFELRSFGPVDVMHKPVNLGTFIPVVQEMLTRKF